ncbi:response regulator transcription factor [Natranaerofaba carboxydovora]|uniref:response regulator transcription factor n=1 Tax=Natranaerofaba carboxydovora TaxID=2742683 RepID=UPI001F13F0B2|nr:response regulator [Natranaerofaba carboxydovora]UMZ72725.1 putative response regulatory protein [Natranaerofaba carboxydovora]
MFKAIVADDESLERKAISSILSKNREIGVEVCGEAGDGKEAIRLARLHKPNLVLIDIKMPGLDGLEATKNIKDEHPDVHVIVITAYDEFDFAQKALKYQASDYLLKPVRPGCLLDAIKKVLQRINHSSESFLPANTNKNTDENNDEENSCDSLIEQSIYYIKENYSKDITLTEVSNAVHLSPYYFSRLFKKKMGMNFIDYLTNLRIEKAKEFLIESNAKVVNITYKVGYKEPAYFSRIFKKHTGITPNDYKKRYKVQF